MIDVEKYNRIYCKVFVVAVTLWLAISLVFNFSWFVLLILPIIVFIFSLYCCPLVVGLLTWAVERFYIKSTIVYILLAILFTGAAFGLMLLIGDCAEGYDFEDEEYWEYKTRFL